MKYFFRSDSSVEKLRSWYQFFSKKFRISTNIRECPMMMYSIKLQNRHFTLLFNSTKTDQKKKFLHERCARRIDKS